MDDQQSDKWLWDIWLSHYVFPTLAVADELGFFEFFLKGPASRTQIQDAFKLTERSTEVLVSLSASNDLLLEERGFYSISNRAKSFMVKSSPLYWGGMFHGWRKYDLYQEIKNAMTNHGSANLHTDRWKADVDDGHPSMPFLEAMQSHSQLSARYLAQSGYFKKSKAILDVGGGSGCFSVEALLANPSARATIQELPSVASVTRSFLNKTAVGSQIEIVGRDMFKDQWPTGHDTIVLSNILHDWDETTCQLILQKAFEALEPGGSLLVHEVLMKDDFTGPSAAAVFSLIMLLRTEGRQWSGRELTDQMHRAGFSNIQIEPGLHHFSIIKAVKS